MQRTFCVLLNAVEARASNLGRSTSDERRDPLNRAAVVGKEAKSAPQFCVLDDAGLLKQFGEAHASGVVHELRLSATSTERTTEHGLFRCGHRVIMKVFGGFLIAIRFFTYAGAERNADRERRVIRRLPATT